MRGGLRFWGWAVGAALLFAAAAALLLPYGALGLRTPAERERAWLLTVWTTGVLAVLFGLTARVGGLRGIGLREVAEAGSVREAIEARRRSESAELTRRADVWIITFGGALIAIYFAGWLVLG
jgi:hypothetical protein